MKAFVLLNPYANRWQAGAHRQALEEALRAAGVPYHLEVSQRRRHAIPLVARAVREGYAPIIAAGGDGTIGEVVNGIAQALGPEGAWPPLGVLPLGTANDLVDNVGLPRQLTNAARVIATGKTRPMDVVQIQVRNAAGETHTWYSANNTALGLEPTITHIQQEMTWAKGNLRYLLATLAGILRHPVWEAELRWEGGSYQGPVNLISVGNHRRTGGLFYMTPHADGFDGRLTFIFAYAKSRLRVLQILPHALKAEGDDLSTVPEVHEIHSPFLEVHLETPSPMHADGELYETQALTLSFRTLPGQIPLLTPP
ncbi:MAG TPA: diacylglycerol kinase family lipid kinase [Anaerolineae bacterium]|nr:diacylglycerol kinase family lipid kinase [Anaerolineae bacterium]HID84578.1 diacylglycerol kinase family lipid kinase [Anaerolineales bacterium]HIQ09577.1 diacylglycerol kinase family lipid kinase [Anaerolineaceae bacterium]